MPDSASHSSDRLPALFLAHGNPMNALADNPFTRSLAAVAASLPRPEAILAWVADALLRGDRDALVGYEAAGAIAHLALPTNEHYVPLLYAAAMRDEGDSVAFTHTGIEMGSMSMRCVRFG